MVFNDIYIYIMYFSLSLVNKLKAPLVLTNSAPASGWAAPFPHGTLIKARWELRGWHSFVLTWDPRTDFSALKC